MKMLFLTKSSVKWTKFIATMVVKYMKTPIKHNTIIDYTRDNANYGSLLTSRTSFLMEFC